MKNEEIKWCNGGNLGFESCKSEAELSDKLDEFMSAVSEQMGEVTYQLDGKTYVIGISINVLELDTEDYEEDAILN